MNPDTVTSSASNRLRPGIVSTRLSPSEMAAVDAAISAAETTRSAWLRDAVMSHLARPEPTPPTSIEPAILEQVMGIRYLILNLFSMANPGTSLQTLHGAMAVADNGKHGAAQRVLATPGQNPTP